MLRVAPDCKNYNKKKVVRQKQEWSKFADEDLINAIFSAIDNIERTVNRSEKTDNVQSLLEIYEIQIELVEEIIGKPQYGTGSLGL